MSSFISSPAPAATAEGAVISLWPFWPDIDVNHFRDVQRIGGTLIPDARLIEIEGVGHLPHIEAFDRFTAALDQLLPGADGS